MKAGLITFNVITGTGGASADNFEGVVGLPTARQLIGPIVAANGTVTFLSDGTVNYTPNLNFVGVDTFTYTIFSGEVTETGTINVTVTDHVPTVTVPGVGASPEAGP